MGAFEFLDEYNRVDNICRELLAKENGIISYLEEMDNVGESSVENWSIVHDYLSRIVESRQNLVHGIAGSEGSLEDLKNLEHFRQLLLSSQDPITLYSGQRQQPVKADNEPAAVVKHPTKAKFEVLTVCFYLILFIAMFALIGLFIVRFIIKASTRGV